MVNTPKWRTYSNGFLIGNEVILTVWKVIVPWIFEHRNFVNYAEVAETRDRHERDYPPNDFVKNWFSTSVFVGQKDFRH